MARVIYEKKNKEKAMIPNAVVEELFMYVMTPKQWRIYTDHIKAGRTSLATAEASKVIKKWFLHWIQQDKQSGIDLNYTAYLLFERGKEVDE